MQSKNRVTRLQISQFLGVVLLLAWPGSAGAQTLVATVPVGASPKAVAINPKTNLIYVANFGGSSISVIDGNTNGLVATLSDPGAIAPVAIAVNSVTNKIYVANSGIGANRGNISVIDGVTNSIATVTDPLASEPLALAINSVTNMIYVANGSGGLTILDGATNAVTNINTGGSPKNTAVAVNTVTNTIYVAVGIACSYADGKWVCGGGGFFVIDGATASVMNLPGLWSNGNSVAVNPVTNKIYVTNGSNSPNSASDSITVINGATDSTTTVTDPNAVGPFALAINIAAKKIYVANSASNNVTEIDGATNSVSVVADANAVRPHALGLDETTNKVYVANAGDYPDGGENPGSVTVIDAATNSTVTIIDPKAKTPTAVAVNPATNKIYVVNSGSNNLTVIAGGGTPTSHTLSVLLAGKGTVTSNPAGLDCTTSCAATFATGTAVDLTASPASGSEFSGWSTNCTGTNACNVMMTTDEFVTAAFSPPPDFSLQPATQSVTVQSGGQATDVITIAPQNGSFPNAIQLSCSTPAATCALSTASVIPGANSATSTLTITAPGLSAVLTPFGEGQPSAPVYAVLLPIQGLVLLGCCLVSGKTKQRRHQLWLLSFLLLAFGTWQAGCGGGSRSSPPPPVPLNFTVTVTAISGAIQHTTQVAVTVP